MNPEKVCEFWADIIAKNSMQKKKEKKKKGFMKREKEREFVFRERNARRPKESAKDKTTSRLSVIHEVSISSIFFFFLGKLKCGTHGFLLLMPSDWSKNIK